jgi:hypothetical protein
MRKIKKMNNQITQKKLKIAKKEMKNNSDTSKFQENDEDMKNMRRI